jgi:hypothetical protein
MLPTTFPARKVLSCSRTFYAKLPETNVKYVTVGKYSCSAKKLLNIICFDLLKGAKDLFGRLFRQFGPSKQKARRALCEALASPSPAIVLKPAWDRLVGHRDRKFGAFICAPVVKIARMGPELFL